jgi:hypothetical protein
MPPKASRAWAFTTNVFVDGENMAHCRIRDANGDRCKHHSPRRADKIATHLKDVHSILPKDFETALLALDAEVKTVAKPTMHPAFAPAKTPLRKFIESFCEQYAPFSDANRPRTRAFWLTCGVDIKCRQTLRKIVVKASQDELNAALAKLKNVRVTLAIDSGTVWSRYFAVLALTSKGPPLLVGAVTDARFPDKRLTATNIAAYMSSLIRYRLQPAGAIVVGYVADNAANMQSALRLIDPTRALPLDPPMNVDEEGEGADSGDEFLEAGAEELGIFEEQITFFFTRGAVRAAFVRCAAHGLQLCVTDLLSTEAWQDLRDQLIQARDAVGIRMRLVETRWNCVFLLLRRVLDVNKSPAARLTIAMRAHFLAAQLMLKPFYQATQIVQRDTCTLWDTAGAIHVLLASTTLAGSEEVIEVINRRSRRSSRTVPRRHTPVHRQSGGDCSFRGGSRTFLQPA